MQDADSAPALARVRLPDGRLEALVVEEPLILAIDGAELVTMRSPGHDLDLARGFLITERIVSGLEAIAAMEPGRRDGIDRLAIRLTEGLKPRAGRLTRVHEIRASCGLCGAPNIDRLAADLPPLRPAKPSLSLAEAIALTERMAAAQTVFPQTGGAHAAALFRAGTLLSLREDVGRHNAVDKVIGDALARGEDLSEAVLTLSGRGGFELVLKALRVGIPVVVSVSAPTSFAVALAEEGGATLIGFARAGRGVVYCDDGRLLGAPR